MRFAKASSLLSLVATTLLVSAAPHKKRVVPTDILVFQFADVLEQLETAFYTQVLAQFQVSDFTSAGFSSGQLAVEQITSIQTDESTHSAVLQAAIQSFGASPITSCQFNFSSALTDVPTMAATARVVENVGVSAYLGGAALISDPVLLTSAASILTVEARHQTILNILSGTGTAIPDPFDIPLTPSEVLALASPFFQGPCDVGISANPILSVTNTGSITPGTQLSFSSPAINSTTDTSGFFCQMLLGGEPISITFPFDSCVVPQINGPVAIFITSDGQPLINNVVDRASTQLVAGPLLTFIDTDPQLLGEDVGINSGSNSTSSNSTSDSGSSASGNTTTYNNSSASIDNSTDSSNASAAAATATDASVNATSTDTSSASAVTATDTSVNATSSLASSTDGSSASAVTDTSVNTASSVATSTNDGGASAATATATATDTSDNTASSVATSTDDSDASAATDSSTDDSDASTATDSSSSVAASTQTISPAEASALISSASSSVSPNSTSAPVASTPSSSS